jgi:hypothetical protein
MSATYHNPWQSAADDRDWLLFFGRRARGDLAAADSAAPFARGALFGAIGVCRRCWPACRCAARWRRTAAPAFSAALSAGFVAAGETAEGRIC